MALVTNYTVKAFNGVYRIYENEKAVQRDESLDFLFPDIGKYIHDLYELYNIMHSKTM